MNVEDRLEILELDLIYFEKEARTLRERIRLATREPLSDEKVREYLIDQYSFVYRDGFTDGVLWAEAQHGIGVEQ
jgi:hypothetical protein